MDGQPVLAITGHHYHDLIDTFAQQDIDLDRVFQDACVYSTRVMGADHVENVTNLACRMALGYRGAAHINFPVDLQDQKPSRSMRSARNVPHHVSAVAGRRIGLPAETDLDLAAQVLNAGKKTAILVGRGALKATKEVLEIAEVLGAPIIKALLGKAVVPDASIYTTGGIGLLGTRPSQDAIETCDTLLLVGTSFPYIEFYPKPGQARAVQIDVDPARIGLRYPIDAALLGSAAETLDALLPRLKRNDDRSFLQTAQDGMKEWDALMLERATRRDVPMKPQVIAHELGQRLSETAIVTSDSGTITTWWARHIPARLGQMYSCSGTLASMAPGLPYAIAAQIAYPDRQVVAFVGDGGFSMLMAEFATCVKYKLPIKVVVIKNNTLGQIKWEQMVFLGNPEYGCELHPIDFAGFARNCGGDGVRIEDPEKCGEQVAAALAHPGPMLIEAVVDPLEPPMPPKIEAKQAYHFAESLARGEPNRAKIAFTALSDKVRELI
jgi:pyruvate dehydrogenase (quinone)/pyruvate oxidase